MSNVSGESRKTIDGYLATLRRRLHELTDEDAREIVEEIRVHILDKTGDGVGADRVAATLAALGTPAELASKYKSEELLQRAQLSRAPKTWTEKALRWMLKGALVMGVFAVSILGYGLGGGLVVAGAAKLMDPRHFGLWRTHKADGTWGWGLGSLPSGEHEVLGWWLIPLGLIVGSVVLALTFRLGSWSVRRLWQGRALRRA
jgi:hypothetical protein